MKMETRPISEKLLVHLVMFLAFTTEALGKWPVLLKFTKVLSD